MAIKDLIAANIAAAFLGGAWTVEAMVRRAAEACGRRERWLLPLARRAFAAFGGPNGPDADALAAFLRSDGGLDRAVSARCAQGEVPLRRLFLAQDRMAPRSGAAASWDVPALATPAELADWLGLGPTDLDWFADCRLWGQDAPEGPMRHYTYRWLVTRRKVRLLEVPKARLKEIQRQLLRGVLERIPPHEAAHAYRRGRSVASYVAPHAGRAVVLHFDLKDFFPSVRASRVHAVFRTAGYLRRVARLLTGLCTSAVPAEVLAARPGGADRRFLSRHLPQGAPTSPALANLCAYRLDRRLEGLGRAAGARYTRYADDLVFSGGEELARALRRFHVAVCRVALEEGFEVNTRKSHFMRQGVRQQVAGIVLNSRPNIERGGFDRLKATLTNCARHGPAGQNRDGHPDFRAYLAGRVAYVAMIHPARGRRLRGLFNRICWEESSHAPPDRPGDVP